MSNSTKIAVNLLYNNIKYNKIRKIICEVMGSRENRRVTFCSIVEKVLNNENNGDYLNKGN